MTIPARVSTGELSEVVGISHGARRSSTFASRFTRLTGMQRRQFAQLLDDLRQGLPIDELHGVIMNTAVTADCVDRHYLIMVQLGSGLSLILEALELPGVQRGSERQHLEGNPPVERELVRFVDHTHAAPADFPDDLKIAQPAALAVTRAAGFSLAGKLLGRPA